jgi:hypothetical protein
MKSRIALVPVAHNNGLEPTVSRVTLLAKECKPRATRPAAQPER